eukprot:3812028-Pyramimonas_sp.AAC.2
MGMHGIPLYFRYGGPSGEKERVISGRCRAVDRHAHRPTLHRLKQRGRACATCEGCTRSSPVCRLPTTREASFPRSRAPETQGDVFDFVKSLRADREGAQCHTAIQSQSSTVPYRAPARHAGDRRRRNPVGLDTDRDQSDAGSA